MSHFRMAANDFSSGEHIGTHMDAPYHFGKNSAKINEVRWEQLHGPAVVIDLTEKVKKMGANASIGAEELKAWEKKHGPIPDRAWILMYSGWAKCWGDRKNYIGTDKLASNYDQDDASVFQWPGFDITAGEWLLENRPNFNGIAVDAIGCDVGRSYLDNHILLLPKGYLCIENMNGNVARLPESGAMVYAPDPPLIFIGRA